MLHCTQDAQALPMPESLCACVRPSGKSLIVRHPQTALTGVHVPQGPKPPPCHGHCKKSRPSQAVATVSVKTRRLVAATNDSNQWKHEARREPVSTCGHQGSPDCPLRAKSRHSRVRCYDIGRPLAEKSTTLSLQCWIFRIPTRNIALRFLTLAVTAPAHHHGANSLSQLGGDHARHE
jgi:hypothetical protein